MEEPKASVSQGTEQFIDDGGESVAIGEVTSEETPKEKEGSNAPAEEKVEEKKDEEMKGDEETPPEKKEEGEQPAKKPEDKEDKEDKLPKGVIKRIDKMRRIQGEAEREVERLRAENEALKQAQERTKNIGEKPDPNNFDTDAEYIEALTDWKVKTTLSEQEQKRQEAEAAARKERGEAEAAERHQEIQKKLKDAGEKYSDFKDVVYRKEVPITEPMVDIMARFENMGDVAYYLGKHTDDCLEIAQSDLADQVFSLKEISDFLKAKEKKVTKTPTPIRPISGTGAGLKDLESLPFPEFRKAMEKLEKEARGG